MVDTLGERLAHGRAELLGAIDQPPLARVRARGRALRRRRRLARVGAGAVLVALGLVAAGPWAGPPDRRTADPPPTPPRVTVYAGAGITLDGLEIPVADVPDLPGTVADAQFPDGAHGFVVAACGCRNGFARTGDGGRTWTRADLPAGFAAERPRLIAFDARRLLLTGGARDYVSTTAGAGWTAAARPSTPQPSARPGDVLGLNPGDGAIGVWSPDGWRGPLARQPEGMTVTWVAATPTATGAWWAGGRTAGGQPTIAATIDRGRSWKTTVLDGGGTVTVQVSALGSHVYAAALDGERRLRGVYHSADGAATFDRTGPAGPAPRLAGELVPLLDGRLLVTSTEHQWWISADDGRTFARTGGDLPSVGPLARTAAGYVAYELFSGDSGWLALSIDGTSWRKLQIR